MFQLNIRHILDRARKYFWKKEIVSRINDDKTIKYNYGEFYSRVCKLANALIEEFGIRPGDKIASLGWNTHRHLELHFAVPCIGAILHTVNIRFSPEEIAYTINHAKDKILFLDTEMLPILEKIREKIKEVKSFVIMGEEKIDEKSYFYEEILKNKSEEFRFDDINENTPAIICYTTGTTGMPKGVIYTHRGIFLRSLATCLADTYAISERDVILHVVPMYHISSWFMPYAATLVGAKQVLPGIKFRPNNIYELIKNEKVTVSDGVPTIWIDFLNYVRSSNVKKEELKSLKKLIIGGSAPPKSLIKSYKEELGIEVIHAWGMTETYDSAVASMVKSYFELKGEEIYDLISKQGIPFPGIEVDAINEKGESIKWNGNEVGELIIRGAWVINEYYGDENKTRESFIGDWLRTGDMVTIDHEGYIEIIDRLKDIIRSGGEVISSIKLENMIMAHPAVLEAAVVAIKDERWGERPIACVVLKEEFKGKVDEIEIKEFLKSKVPNWWLPDKILFLDSLPKTSVGKIDKKVLRKTFSNK